MTFCNAGQAVSEEPTPVPTSNTSVAALAQAPKIIGRAAPKPYRALLLSTRMLVGPGVMDATKAKSRKGSNVGKEESIAGKLR
ncbi:hypothetical protein D3C87_1577730 [compost metagenome]